MEKTTIHILHTPMHKANLRRNILPPKAVSDRHETLSIGAHAPLY
jgi:hypothetical protein